MEVMPILFQDKIYNVCIKPKNMYEEREIGAFEKHYESDIIVNGQSYNISSYNEKNAPLTNTINFIRNNSLYTNTSFLLTTRRNDKGKMKTYRISQPPMKVSEGLDSLYSSVIQNIKKDVPGKVDGRAISLKRLGVTDHLTDEKLSFLYKLKRENNVESSKGKEILEEFERTISFLNIFDCMIIDEATVDLKALEGVIVPFDAVGLKENKKLRTYYEIAKENAEEYAKLENLAQIVTGKSIGWFHKDKSVVKTKGFSHEYRKCA